LKKRVAHMKTIADYIKRPLVTIEAERSVLDAIILMQEQSVSSIVILEGGNPVGIFTERDILNKVNFREIGALPSLKIRDMMTGGLKIADINDSYISILESMQNNKIRHMPVTREKAMIGMVSLRDLLDYYYENLEHVLEETVAALSSAVEKRDPYTAGHQARVAQLACAIAKDMNLSQKQISGLRMAAIIHDIGKLYIPAEILTKPVKLTDAEFDLIKIHSQIGYDILKGIEFPWPVADIVLQHHERINGSGYPKGLMGKDILIEAKIIGLSDVVEAMLNDRPYRPMRGMEKTLKEIEINKGVLYEVAIVESCIRILKRKEVYWETIDYNVLSVH
jgi:putative nucleotidyltransferase with HDIG domain